MHRGAWAVALALIVACDSETSGQQDAAHGGTGDASASDANSAPQCVERGLTQYFGIASASLADTRLHFEPEVSLTEPGLDEILYAKLNGLLDLSWQRDRFVVSTFGGFWDIEPGHDPRWIDTGGLMHGVVSGDIDGDGDLDLLFGASQSETLEVAGVSVPAYATRFHVWERTTTGLVKRTEILSQIPGGVVGMPFAFLDIDRDSKLDIVSYWDSQVVGYFGDGQFGFRREVLEQSDPELAPWGALIVRIEDRNRDGIEDLLAVMGRGGPDVTFRNLVFPRDAAGRFQHHAPPAEFEQSPSPIDAGDVTGDGLSDIVAQGFEDETPTLRLTASVDWSAFAPSRSLLPASLGVKLGDVDADGTLDVLTTANDRLLALLSRSGEFEPRALGISMTTANLLDFAVRPRSGKRPASLQVLFSVPCDPACDPACLDRCFTTGCRICEAESECASGFCAAGSCAAGEPRVL